MYSPTEAIISNAVIHIPTPVHWAPVLLGMRAWRGPGLQSCVKAAVLTVLLVSKHLESLHLPPLLHPGHRRVSGILHLKRRSQVFLHSVSHSTVMHGASVTHKRTETDSCRRFFPTLPNLMADIRNINLACYLRDVWHSIFARPSCGRHANHYDSVR